MITVEKQGFDDLADRLGKAETFVRIRQNEGLREIGQIMTAELKRFTPIGATGDLRNKTRFQVIGGPQAQELQVRQGAKSATGFFYGRAVREGRRPGRMPPPSALVPWVIRKLGVPPEQARPVAFMVARKIGQRGTRPNRYHRRALRAAWARIQAVVDRIGLKVSVDLAGGRQT